MVPPRSNGPRERLARVRRGTMAAASRRMDDRAVAVASALAAARFSTTALVVAVGRVAYLVDVLELGAECAGDRADGRAEPGERRVGAEPGGVVGVVFEDTAFYE